MTARQSMLLIALLLVALPVYPAPYGTQSTVSHRHTGPVFGPRTADPHHTHAAAHRYADTSPTTNASNNRRYLATAHEVPIDAQYVTDQLSLGNRLHYYADRGGQLTIKSILRRHGSLAWKRSTHAIPTFGFTKSTYWFYVDVANPTSVSLSKILQVADPLIDDIRLYVTSGNHILDSYHSGLNFPFQQRPLINHDFAFPIHVAPHEKVRIYISAHTLSDGVRMPAYLWGMRTWHSETQSDYLINGMYFGLLLGLMLYNLFLFFVIKDMAYLYYSLFQLTFSIFQLASSGYGYQFLWPDHVGLNTPVTYMFVCLPGAFLAFFTHRILAIKGSSNLINRSWLALGGLFTVGLALTPFITDKLYIGLIALNPVILIMAALFAVTSFRYWQLGLVARIWTVALLIFIAGAVLYVLPAAGLVEANTFFKHTLQLGSALEAILLSLLLGHRIRKEQKEKFELLGRSEEIRQATIAKSRFLAAASHDLRQPLHALSLFIDVLRDEGDANERQRIFSKIELSLDAMRKLFDALMDVSKLDANVVHPDYTHFELGDLIRSLEEEFRPIADDKGITLRVHGSPAIVVSDRMLLARILRNLIGNALRYTESGGVLISFRGRGDAILVQVWDTGIGIPAENQDEIFDEFFQLHYTDRGQGLGLGLAIVKRLCLLLNHPLELRSRPGHGSVFGVRIPKGTRSMISENQAAKATHSWDLSGRKILVIDDEREILDGMQTLLTKWGCSVIIAESLADAEKKLEASKITPDLILSDLRLRNGTTGVDAIDRLRERLGASVPAVLITGDTTSDHIQLAKASGYDLLQKPVQPMRLRSLIQQQLTKHATTLN